jgi:protein-disulfide isomerase
MASTKISQANKETKVSAVEVSTDANQLVVNGESMKDKLVPFLVALVVIGAFAVGLLYGKVSVYEQGGSVRNPAGTADVIPGGAQPEPPQEVVLTDEMWQELITEPAAAIGDANAPVVMVEFADYQCPFCARYFSETYGQIKTNFIDTGKVRYLIRDLPLTFHQNAKPAAIAARCAGDQGKYFEMHDALYENQQEWSNVNPKDHFVRYAGEIGLNGNNFTSCYDGGKYDSVVDEELGLASRVGATGTPTFFINGEKLVGAQPYVAFEDVLNRAAQ